MTLAPGERARVGGGDLTLTFVRVVRDDRCPLGVFCIRFGDAQVAIAARSGRHDTTFFLSTADTAPPATVGSYRIRLEELAPVRRQDAAIAAGAYRATLSVTSLSGPPASR